MTAEQNFFKNLPKGKITGFCQPPNSSVWKDGGLVVEIKKDCRLCGISKCMMFEDVVSEEGMTIAKKFIQHDPEW